CRANHYGPDCAETCECHNSSQCDRRSGRCSCLHGWIGLSCREGGPPSLNYGNSSRGDTQHENSL
ncbi:50S ribosomal protein L30, partial [Dissostichus eleginoides]